MTIFLLDVLKKTLVVNDLFGTRMKVIILLDICKNVFLIFRSKLTFNMKKKITE